MFEVSFNVGSISILKRNRFSIFQYRHHERRSTKTSIFESILIWQKILRLLFEGAIACKKGTMPRVEG